ncbi:MAG: type II toxin-antitoxin system VapC family toxin [Acidobacteriota bacterium]|nr:type II toxin-antitoxin system VapC family toxin [Acidobacteriota bacterium]
MNLLLDSHAFIWAYDQQHRLSQPALQAMSNTANALFLSVASVWEIQIKIMIGKFKLQDSLTDVIAEQQQINGLQILPIELSHALYLENLPLYHKDPFDRLLISQAIVENMTLVSADANFAKYQVNLLW